MAKKVIVAGLIGTLVMLIWIMLVNGLFGLENRLTMETVAEESILHGELGRQAPEPGGYIVNPPPGDRGRFGDGPVYGLSHSGLGHGDAGTMMIVNLLAAFLISLLAASLFVYGRPVGGGYGRRLGFFVLLGIFTVLVADLPRWGIGGLPLASVLLMAARDLGAWALVGLALAAWLREPAKA